MTRRALPAYERERNDASEAMLASLSLGCSFKDAVDDGPDDAGIGPLPKDAVDDGPDDAGGGQRDGQLRGNEPHDEPLQSEALVVLGHLR